MSLNFNHTSNNKHLFEGGFGLEKENLRTDKDGFLSHTFHPFADDKHIDRDFCENQVEFITDICESPDEVYSQLQALQKSAEKTLCSLKTGRELIWPFSNPPYVKGEDDIVIAKFSDDLKYKEEYRKHLAKKYGKKKMLFCGIHYNFSISEELLTNCFCNDHSALSPCDYSEYKNRLYLELAAKATAYSWLIVYLTAASPVFDKSYFDGTSFGTAVTSSYTSARCSRIGYWNDFVPLLDYANLNKYVGSIETYVKSGQLKNASELYYPVRLKPKGENTLDNLRSSGVDHIELRVLDLNPLSPIGIIKEDVSFIHFMLIYLLHLPCEDFEAKRQYAAITNIKKAAEAGDSVRIEFPYGCTMSIRGAALDLLNDMMGFYAQFDDDHGAADVINYQIKKIQSPETGYANIICRYFSDDYVKKGVELAEKYLTS